MRISDWSSDVCSSYLTHGIDPLDLAKALIAAPSVTPATGAVFDVLEAALTPLGFTVERFIDGIEPDGPVENLLAVRTRSEERRVGKGGCSTCRSRWSALH